MQYHKDKFVAPILYKEMCAMEVKKNGKVEHSSNSHDDSIFSYLHALYIWYDGEDLMERFKIQKNTIKTDEDIEVVESSIEDQLEKKERIDLKSLECDEDESEIMDAYKFIEENSQFKTSDDLRVETYFNDLSQKELLLQRDEKARKSYCEQTGLDPSMFTMDAGNQSFVSLPDELFMNSNNTLSSDFLDDNEMVGVHNISPLAGNLSQWWDSL